ncbi:MAG: polyprenyl diphosphate synthase [Steroidobacteraceae bacterium]|jgi:undecaprenyl diphosphate synthase
MNRMSLPRHVAIVMDGNGRWAQGRGRERVAGHQAGIEPVRQVIRDCVRLGIGALTLFAFSSENWGRPPEEVAALMSLFLEAMAAEMPELHSNGVRLRFIGERATLAEDLRARMGEAEALTAANVRLQLQVAVSYGGRWDLLQAARQLARAGSALTSEAEFSRALALGPLGELADPDLFIRTGGEHRISNFLLWNLAYAELYFTDTLWPDFDSAAFEQALAAFAGRTRRFGLTDAQRQAH